jgi:hypothetical protein
VQSPEFKPQDHQEKEKEKEKEIHFKKHMRCIIL